MFEKNLHLKGFESTLATLRRWVNANNTWLCVVCVGIFKGYFLSPAQSSRSVSPAVGSSAQNFDALLLGAELTALSPHLLCKVENKCAEKEVVRLASY